jgi:hypothetical protein
MYEHLAPGCWMPRRSDDIASAARAEHDNRDRRAAGHGAFGVQFAANRANGTKSAAAKQIRRAMDWPLKGAPGNPCPGGDDEEVRLHLRATRHR